MQLMYDWESQTHSDCYRDSDKVTLMSSSTNVIPGKIDHAVPVRVSDISEESVGCKVRLVGRVLVHDVKTHFMFLASPSHSLWVDASVCFDPMDTASVPYLVQYNSPVMIIGYIEQNEVSIPPPYLESRPPAHHSSVLCRAILSRPCPNLDLELWDRSLELRKNVLGMGIVAT
ncbi:hypothetical protein BS47DRAFT_1338363 [Hydnum rufescens UP504]|uniref:Uncharacterized protein n=1 Tax=Hydnum rufescens UP504 TaxID=1448309 RepID=A0A9P6B7L2_9AGAM|nr:hypothetical protein BS47DRAFT_1338363 [Hydnum rufescens UP504]